MLHTGRLLTSILFILKNMIIQWVTKRYACSHPVSFVSKVSQGWLGRGRDEWGPSSGHVEWVRQVPDRARLSVGSGLPPKVSEETPSQFCDSHSFFYTTPVSFSGWTQLFPGQRPPKFSWRSSLEWTLCNMRMDTVPGEWTLCNMKMDTVAGDWALCNVSTLCRVQRKPVS